MYVKVIGEVEECEVNRVKLKVRLKVVALKGLINYFKSDENRDG